MLSDLSPRTQRRLNRMNRAIAADSSGLTAGFASQHANAVDSADLDTIINKQEEELEHAGLNVELAFPDSTPASEEMAPASSDPALTATTPPKGGSGGGGTSKPPTDAPSTPRSVAEIEDDEEWDEADPQKGGELLTELLKAYKQEANETTYEVKVGSKTIDVTHEWVQNEAKDATARVGKLDITAGTKALAHYCAHHTFDPDKGLESQQRDFANEIKDPRMRAVFDKFSDVGSHGYYVWALEQHVSKRDSTYMIPEQVLKTAVGVLSNCLDSFVKGDDADCDSDLAKALTAIDNTTEANPLKARFTILADYIASQDGISSSIDLLREKYNATTFRPADDQNQLLSTYATELRDKAKAVNAKAPGAISEPEICSRISAQLRLARTDPSLTYDHHLAAFSDDLDVGRVTMPTDFPSALLLVQKVETKARQQGWRPTVVTVNGVKVKKSHPEDNDKSKEKKERKAHKATAQVPDIAPPAPSSGWPTLTPDQYLQFIAHLQAPPAAAPPGNNDKHNNTKQKQKEAQQGGATTQLALRLGDSTTPALGKACMLCGSREHKTWDECPLGPKIFGKPSPYLGQSNGKGGFACITCGSPDHTSHDCDHPTGFHGQGGPKAPHNLNKKNMPQLAVIKPPPSPPKLKEQKGKGESKSPSDNWGSDSDSTTSSEDDEPAQTQSVARRCVTFNDQNKDGCGGNDVPMTQLFDDNPRKNSAYRKHQRGYK